MSQEERDMWAGAVKGLVHLAKDEIISLVENFRNREYAFIENPSTIKLLKKILKHPEWNIYERYIIDPDHRKCAQMGITLRRLENNFDELKELYLFS